MKLFLIFLILPILMSFKLQPMSLSLDLVDEKKAVQFMVENDGAENIAVELTVKERKMGPNGVEELPDTTLLSIFPPQMIIPPNEKRTVRVLWKGPEKIDSEKSFRVIAEQLPMNVSNKKRGTGIQMLMKFMAAFYVAPPEAESKVSVQFISSVKGKLNFKIINSGNKHQIIFKPKLTLKKGSEKWVLTENDLFGIAGENILAKSERIFEVNYSKIIPSDADISLKFEE